MISSKSSLLNLPRTILKHFLKIQLSEDEVDLLKFALAGFYKSSAGGNFTKDTFTNFLSKGMPDS